MELVVTAILVNACDEIEKLYVSEKIEKSLSIPKWLSLEEIDDKVKKEMITIKLFIGQWNYPNGKWFLGSPSLVGKDFYLKFNANLDERAIDSLRTLPTFHL